MHTTTTKILAVIAAAALCLGLFSGCRTESAPQPGASAPLTAGEANLLASYRRDREPVPFGALDYRRPDLTEIKRLVKERVQGIGKGSSLEETLEHLAGARDILNSYDTMYVLSMIYSDLDPYSDYWYDEYLFCDENYITYGELWNDVYTALERSAYSAQLLPLWDPDHDATYSAGADTGKADALLFIIDDIVDEALDILYYDTITYNGQRLTLDDAYDHEDWVEATEAWLEAYGEELLELYTQMVVNGSRVAREFYSYDNLAEYFFDSYGRDYTPEMAQTFIQGVIKDLYPLEAEVDYDYWYDNSGYYIDFAGCLEIARQVLPLMDQRMVDALELMLEYDLYAVDAVDFYVRPYVIHLAAPNVPFLICPYYDDLESVVGFTHEFGHFYEIYLTMDDNSLSDDLSEVHSQAMSLLLAQAYLELSGEDELLEYSLMSITDTILSHSFGAAIELPVFMLPQQEITADNIRRIGIEQSVLYGYGEDEDDPFAKYYWLTDSEMFTDPLQPLCYAVSAGVALELWQLSLEDMEEALARYNQLVLHEGSYRFMANVEAAGLQSPFAQGWSRETAGYLSGELGGAWNLAA